MVPLESVKLGARGDIGLGSPLRSIMTSVFPRLFRVVVGVGCEVGGIRQAELPVIRRIPWKRQES